MKNLAWFAILMTFTVQAVGDEVVAKFQGSTNRVTPEFKVVAPWIMDWRVTTDGDYDARVEVTLEQARTGVYEGSVLKAKYPGNGVRMFNESGVYQFRVTALLANWTLTVKQLTEEEAAEYTPREKAVPD